MGTGRCYQLDDKRLVTDLLQRTVQSVTNGSRNIFYRLFFSGYACWRGFRWSDSGLVVKDERPSPHMVASYRFSDSCSGYIYSKLYNNFVGNGRWFFDLCADTPLH